MNEQTLTVLRFLEDYDVDLGAERKGEKPSWATHEEGAHELVRRLAEPDSEPVVASDVKVGFLLILPTGPLVLVQRIQEIYLGNTVGRDMSGAVRLPVPPYVMAPRYAWRVIKFETVDRHTNPPTTYNIVRFPHEVMTRACSRHTYGEPRGSL